MNIFVAGRWLQRLDELSEKPIKPKHGKRSLIVRWMLVLSRSNAAIDLGDVKLTEASNASFQVKASRISFIFIIGPKLLEVLHCMSKWIRKYTLWSESQQMLSSSCLYSLIVNGHRKWTLWKLNFMLCVLVVKDEHIWTSWVLTFEKLKLVLSIL